MADTEGDLQTWRLSELGKAKEINLSKPLKSLMRKLRPRDQGNTSSTVVLWILEPRTPPAHKAGALSIKLANLQP